MRAALRLRDDELAAEKLERLAFEGTEVDEAVVLDAAPALRRERRLLHGRSLAMAVSSVNVSTPIQPARRGGAVYPGPAPCVET
jgi:hypothetical protein